MLPLIAPILGIIVTTSTSIAIEGVAKQLIPAGIKALPAFGLKLGVAVTGGLIASKVSSYVVSQVNSVITTATTTGSEEVLPAPAED